jgi:hypothetical protein
MLWPVAAIVRRTLQQAVPDDGLSPRLRGISRITVLIAFALLFTFVFFFTQAVGGSIKPNSGIDIYLRIIQLLGILSLIGTVACVVAAVISLIRGNNGVSKLKYAALALACVGFSWFILHWNILTSNLDF